MALAHVPLSVQTQINQCVTEMRLILGTSCALVVHGSIALDDFQLDQSDIDILGFVDTTLTAIQLRAVMQVLVMQVEDSGPGIPAAERALVLQPFYRALGTNVDGSGLGLSIVNEIVKQHHGEIQIEPMQAGASMPGTRISLRFRIQNA